MIHIVCRVTFRENATADGTSMVDDQEKPERLELLLFHRSRPWPYLLSGALLGAAFEMLINAPLDAVFRYLFAYLFAGNPPKLTSALAHLARPAEWPAVSLTGFILGAALGLVFYRLKEHQKRLLILRQEFEIQVSSVRHHYKNLAVGISGFSSRAKRKLENLKLLINDCAFANDDIQVELKALEQSVDILENASKGLTSTLTEELTFLKALQSNNLTPAPRDILPVMQHSIQELMELRFRDKAIGVEINGRPFQEPCAPLVFPFEPYTMEIILQNILSNAMRYGDIVHVRTEEHNRTISLEICDNGPGIDVKEIKRSLTGAGERREADSTLLGLRVALHLLEKCGGRLYASNKPNGGGVFLLEFPK
jgi:signal transduction histidine kinase